MTSTAKNEYKEFDSEELLKNPTLEALATVTVDLIEMGQGQMQSNIVFSALVNAVLAVLVENNLTTEEAFGEHMTKSLEQLESQYNSSLEAFDKQYEESLKTNPEEEPKAPSESADD